ncbi:RNA polymerase II assembly factor RTP1 [Candida tropicalis]
MKSLLALESTNAAAGALRTRIQDLVSGNHALSADNELDNQRHILSRAITSLNDPLVPIRAHGLYLLRQLVEKKSTVTTLDFVINLHLVQLKDPEPFIYLNVIKGLENLLEWDKVGVLQKLCKMYSNDDDEGDTDLDERVKIGEVLLRFIKHENELFGGESAELIINAVMKLIRKVGNEERDHRLDMSALSILGECVTSNIFAVNINEVLDCCIGVLDLEKSSIIRRAAIVVIHDVLVALSEKENIEFPADYRDRVKTALGYTAEFDKDYLTKEHAKKVLTYFE